MLMSKSRLEKFLYALYSLDSSNLPTPLSRIEELYKCLVTGEEAPTFEPLSRVEKYLMAILGVYDVDSLPNPLSRVEVLLYKLATGDDNLDDVEMFLSEHEELLAEIIRNGGVGGNINIEYVLYTLSTEHNTLYNTAEKPVKSAILKGNTLVNLISGYGFGGDLNLYEYRFYEQPVQGGETLTIFVVNPNITTIKVGIHNSITNTWVREEAFDVSINKKVVYTVPSNSLTKYVGVVVPNQNDSTGFENGLVIVRGDQSHLEVNTYFEGMKSVQMPVLTTTGKNLFDDRFTTVSNYDNQLYSRINLNKIMGNNRNFTISILQELNSKGKIWFNVYVNGIAKKNLITNGETQGHSCSFSLNEENNVELGLYCERISKEQALEIIKNEFKIQLEEGSVATEYEPYKSNILTVNEPVELRGIDDVQDTLDCLTGEVTERIGEVVLDGSEKWTKYGSYTLDGYFSFVASMPSLNNLYGKSMSFISADFATGSWSYYVNNKGAEVVWNHDRDKIGIRVKSEKASDVTEIKEFLSTNNIRISYKLATESVKTIDISTVNQDGNSTKLKTFDDITHVTLSSEGPIPEAEMEVATKNEEVLSTLSLEMDDISTSQNTLEETSNTQGENVDATMIATTEIYEQLL